MFLKDLLNRYANIGTRPDHKPWEVSLIRKLNLITFVGVFNISSALLIFYILNFTYLYAACISVLLVAPLVIIFNRAGKYIWAAYAFNFIGFIFFALLNLRMGLHSFFIVLYFPLVIAIVQLLARKETMKHMVGVLVLGFISFCIVLFGLRAHWLQVNYSNEMMANLQMINLFFGFFTTFAFVIVISYEANKQESLIKSMLHEKDILLAEVFHRVKNNMTIVTSLLNLKKNASSSPEVKEALEECRDRVFAMALVHQKIYSTESFTSLNLKEYVNDLVNALKASMVNADAKIELVCEDIDLELTHAIPCGLILNELITNSFKYASNPNSKLEISIDIKRVGKEVTFVYKDNGPGLQADPSKNKNSLGFDLIGSLVDQLDAKSEFKSNNGFLFDLRFSLK